MNKNFIIHTTPLDELVVIERTRKSDSRGFFERLYCVSELSDILKNRAITQINQTFTSKKGSVRGLHYQIFPFSEMKFITCLRGIIFDVALDLRKESPTFLSWHSQILSASDNKTYVIPEGYAHGFQTLSNDCQILYFHTSDYTPDAEGGVHPCDPKISITWPLPVTGLSPKDMKFPMIKHDFNGI